MLDHDGVESETLGSFSFFFFFFFFIDPLIRTISCKLHQERY